jgi:hypothetical protein
MSITGGYGEHLSMPGNYQQSVATTQQQDHPVHDRDEEPQNQSASGSRNEANAISIRFIEQMIASAREEIKREKRTKARLEMDIQEAKRSEDRKKHALMELRQAAANLEAERMETESSPGGIGSGGGGRTRRRFPGEWPEL